jgi:hypothetical protein
LGVRLNHAIIVKCQKLDAHGRLGCFVDSHQNGLSSWNQDLSLSLKWKCCSGVAVASLFLGI